MEPMEPTRPALASPAAAHTPPPGPPYDRVRWEKAMLERRMHPMTQLTAFVLAHAAGVGGCLPEDGIQRSDRLAGLTRLPVRSVKHALRNLRKAGLVWRPHSEPGWRGKARQVVLTVPARREEPPHTGEQP